MYIHTTRKNLHQTAFHLYTRSATVQSHVWILMTPLSARTRHAQRCDGTCGHAGCAEPPRRRQLLRNSGASAQGLPGGFAVRLKHVFTKKSNLRRFAFVPRARANDSKGCGVQMFGASDRGQSSHCNQKQYLKKTQHILEAIDHLELDDGVPLGKYILLEKRAFAQRMPTLIDIFEADDFR